eukprot:355301-Chlamydomonas_euryale.AAC.10
MLAANIWSQRRQPHDISFPLKILILLEPGSRVTGSGPTRGMPVSSAARGDQTAGWALSEML